MMMTKFIGLDNSLMESNHYKPTRDELFWDDFVYHGGLAEPPKACIMESNHD